MSRRLKPEELELWQKVADNTQALHRRSVFDPAAVASRRVEKTLEPRRPLAPESPKPRAPSAPTLRYDLAPTMSDRLQCAPVQMDRKTFTKMKRGKLAPEGRIDLHGMTLDHAHGVLHRFILTSHAAGKRLVLVITGKGKHRDDGGPIPVRFGVLRHQVPQWLATPPLSAHVMQVTQAHVSHGGGGAYYVYLRRNR